MSAAKINQSLHLKQSQQLVMTPQLQQAIKLLQMNNLELDAFLETQLEHNPLLEKAEPERGDASIEDMAAAEDSADTIDAAFDQNWDEARTEGPGRPEGSLSDFDAGSSMAAIGKGGRLNFDDSESSFENTLSTTKTLRDHLGDQLQQEFSDPTDRRIGALLIDMLDEAGYLRVEAQELATRLGVAPARLEAVLETLRGFDPAGIFARDLADCLALQLRDRGRLDEPFRIFLQHLDLIAAHEHRKLAQLCAVNETYLRDMLTELKTLSPKPAAAFDHVVAQTAIPDALMRALPKNIGGGWRVELNTETLPRVLVNNTYYHDVLARARGEGDKNYLNAQMAEANWLVRALDQRAQTILKVSAEIVERQSAFFLYGIEYLTPMTLKDIAAAIDMHESTVSRVTTGKFIGTPRGIFELKFFFTNAIAGSDGGTHSAESVKARIKALIEVEAPDAVLSDDTIVEALKREGIEIARRTVAKYREGMNIPTSAIRKRIKKNQSA